MSGDGSIAATGDDKNQTAITPTDNDVLCGRGGSIHSHPGNETYRQFVERRKRVYVTARFKREKRMIAEAIVKEIRSQDPPGRFLAKQGGNKTGDEWYDIGDLKARDKTNQALRENAPLVRKAVEAEKAAKEEEEKAAAAAKAQLPPNGDAKRQQPPHGGPGPHFGSYGHPPHPSAPHGHGQHGPGPGGVPPWGYPGHPHGHPPPHPAHGYGGYPSHPHPPLHPQHLPPPPPSHPHHDLPNMVTSAVPNVPATFGLGAPVAPNRSSSPQEGGQPPQHTHLHPAAHPPGPPPAGYYAQPHPQQQPHGAAAASTRSNGFERPSHYGGGGSSSSNRRHPQQIVDAPIIDEEDDDMDDEQNGAYHSSSQNAIPHSPSSGTFNSIVSGNKSAKKKSRHDNSSGASAPIIGEIEQRLQSHAPGRSSSSRRRTLSVSPIPASSSQYNSAQEEDNNTQSSGLFQVAQQILSPSFHNTGFGGWSLGRSKDANDADMDGGGTVHTNGTLPTIPRSMMAEDDEVSEEGQEVELYEMDVEETVMPPPPPPRQRPSRHQREQQAAAATLKRARDRIAAGGGGGDSEIRNPPPGGGGEADWQRQAGGCHSWFKDSIKDNLPATAADLLFDKSSSRSVGTGSSGNQSAGSGNHLPGGVPSISPGVQSINSIIDMDGMSLCNSTFAGSVGTSVGGQSLAHVFDGDSIAASTTQTAQSKVATGGTMPPASPLCHPDNRSVAAPSSFCDRSLMGKPSSVKGMDNLSMTHSMETALHQAAASAGGGESMVGAGGDDSIWSWDGKSHGE